MRRAEQGFSVAIPLKHLLSRFSGLPRIEVYEHAQLRIKDLQWRVDHIAGYDCNRPAVPDFDRKMVDRMPRRWDELNKILQYVVTFYELCAICIDHWNYRIADPRAGLWLL